MALKNGITEDTRFLLYCFVCEKKKKKKKKKNTHHEDTRFLIFIFLVLLQEREEFKKNKKKEEEEIPSLFRFSCKLLAIRITCLVPFPF